MHGFHVAKTKTTIFVAFFFAHLIIYSCADDVEELAKQLNKDNILFLFYYFHPFFRPRT